MNYLKTGMERAPEDTSALRTTVFTMIDTVCRRGDAALQEYAAQFDGCTRENFRISPAEIQEAYTLVDPAEIDDMKAAQANILAFAKAQRASMGAVEDFSPMEGIYLSHRILPVASCLAYVPGGNYPLYSTALMLITPAKVAGVGRICACSPPMKGTGKIHPRTLVAMDLAGADEIYALGGAQAIAAFAYGTETIQPVDLVVGPGNRYVTEAKRQCYGQIGIDFVAGPSEVLAIADAQADPETIAADLLAQSEHDVNAKAILVTTDQAFGERVMTAVQSQLKTLPTGQIAAKSWQDHGEVLVAEDLAEAVAIANQLAPEHLEVNLQDPDAILEQLTQYGSLFIGQNTAEVFGDYASGTNHTLPTIGAARYTGGVWVGTFLKVCTSQRMDPAAARAIAPLVSRMARGEGLEGHARAAEQRLK